MCFRLRAICIQIVLLFSGSVATAAPAVIPELDETLSELVRDAQERKPETIDMNSGVRLRLVAEDNVLPVGLSYRITALRGTPESADEGRNGIQPGLYKLTVEIAGKAQFEKEFIALAGRGSDLELTYLKGQFTLRQTLEFTQPKFQPGKSLLAKGSKRNLDVLADFLKDELSIARIGIEVHTDANGDETKNIELTAARAIQIRNELVKRGVDPARIMAQGKGSSRALVPNDSKENRLLNRRTEFVILELEAPESPRLLGHS